ncbi:MAG: glycosyltransferase [Bacteroidetes bacterium]|nr:glycosyltransferase [Bacteroidota bacterium]
MPKVSIITINYNDAAGLEKTIRSVIAQTYTDLEFVVIDGGSTDGSVDVIKKYADKITFWVSEKDKGIFNAQNKGIEKASGEYCLFLNSGDFLVNENVLKNAFSYNYSTAIIYGDMQIDVGNNQIVHGKMPEKISFYQMYSDTLWHPVSFIKRELFTKFGNYDETFKMVADYDFFFRAIIMNNVSTQHIPLEISVYNVNGFSSKSEFKSIEKAERLAVLNKYLPPAIVAYLTENIKIKDAGKKTIYQRIINRLK